MSPPAWTQEFAELKRQNADALPFDLHRDEFQTSTTSPGLSTDEDDFDDEEDHVDSEDGGQVSAALTSTVPSHADAIPDLIPNQRTTAADDGSSDDRLAPYTSLHNGRSNDRRWSPQDLQKSTLLSVLHDEKSAVLFLHCRNYRTS